MEVRLAFQRAGTTTWVDIDPSTPEGRRALALFNHPKETSAMTTATARIAERPSTTVRDPETGARWNLENGTMEKASFFGGLFAKARGLFRRAVAYVKSGWARVSEALHLDAVTTRVRGALAYAKAKAIAGIRIIGGDGFAGLGLLSISTEAGRKVLGFVLRPVGWVLRGIGTAYCWVEETVDNDGKGGIRTWVANRMGDVREFFFGNLGKDGVIPTALFWVVSNFGEYIHVDSLQMRALRAGGTALVGRRAIAVVLARFAAVAGIPFIGLALTLALTAATVAPFIPEIKAGYNVVATKFRANVEQAEETVDETVDELKETTAAAAAMSAGNAPVNRQQRRDGAKKATPARRR